MIDERFHERLINTFIISRLIEHQVLSTYVYIVMKTNQVKKNDTMCAHAYNVDCKNYLFSSFANVQYMHKLLIVL
jgi:hypothetical protein